MLFVLSAIPLLTFEGLPEILHLDDPLDDKLPFVQLGLGLRIFLGQLDVDDDELHIGAGKAWVGDLYVFMEWFCGNCEAAGREVRRKGIVVSVQASRKSRM
jgi:hypothetical protein